MYEYLQLLILFYEDTYKESIPIFTSLVENLKALKQAFPDATRRYLGNAMGMPEDVVEKWLSGQSKPRLDTFFLLWKALGLFGPHQLFYKTDVY